MIKSLIDLLNTRESKQFVRYLEARDKVGEKQGLRLYQLMRKGNWDKENHCKHLYGNNNFNAYRVLRKRLKDNLLYFLSQNLSEERFDGIQVRLRYYLIAKYVLEQKTIPALAINLIEKATKLAKKQEDYSLLYDIYNTQLEHAHRINIWDIASVKTAAQENLLELDKEQKMSMLYADVRQQLHHIRHNSVQIDLKTWYQGKIKEYQIEDEDLFSIKALYQLTTILSLTAFVANDYGMIAALLEENYAKVSVSDKTKRDAYYYIQVLYHMANLNFRIRKLERCLFFLEKMGGYLQEDSAKNWRLERIKQQNLKALCLHYFGEVEKSITIVTAELRKKIPDLELELDLRLSLVMYYYQSGELEEAFRLLHKFYHSATWYIQKAGLEWAIRKAIIEIMLAIDLDKQELVDAYLKAFKRKYFLYLKDVKLFFVIDFVGLVEEIYISPEVLKEPDFEEKLKQLFTANSNSDILMLSFFAWLQSKWQDTDLYRTTLMLVGRN